MYDPDPIATLRRRRVSNDSVDSGGSLTDHYNQRLHPSVQLHMQATPTKKEAGLLSPNSAASTTPSPSTSTKKSPSTVSATTAAAPGANKHKKRHKHHHCNKHKHKV